MAALQWWTVRRDMRLDTATASWRGRTTVVVALRTARGQVGWGEVAPLPQADDAVVAARDAVERAAAHVRGGVVPEEPDGVRGWWRAAVPEAPQAVIGALETAVLDVLAQQRGLPLWALWRSDAPPRLPVNALVTDADQCARWAARGVRCFKVKVAVKDVEDEVRALRHMARACGGQAVFRLDCNRGYRDVDAGLRALERFGSAVPVDYVEEPFARPEDYAGGDVPVPLAVDESVGDPAFEQAVAATGRWCAVVIKPAVWGMGGALEQAARAAKAGRRVVISHGFEGPVGYAAACHAAVAAGVEEPCGLAPYPAVAAVPFARVRGGGLDVPSEPGLGVGGDPGEGLS